MDGIPAQVVEVLGRTGMRGEASSVKVRVLAGDDRGRIIRRNVIGPVAIGDQLLLIDSSREAKALDRRLVWQRPRNVHSQVSLFHQELV